MRRRPGSSCRQTVRQRPRIAACTHVCWTGCVSPACSSAMDTSRASRSCLQAGHSAWRGRCRWMRCADSVCNWRRRRTGRSHLPARACCFCAVRNTGACGWYQRSSWRCCSARRRPHRQPAPPALVIGMKRGWRIWSSARSRIGPRSPAMSRTCSGWCPVIERVTLRQPGACSGHDAKLLRHRRSSIADCRGRLLRGARRPVIGSVILRAGASVWFNCVLRADDEIIEVGAGSNVQDGSIIHCDPARPRLSDAMPRSVT